MDKADDVDFGPQACEDGTAERTQPGMPEDVFGKRADALTFSVKVVLSSESDPGAMYHCALTCSARTGRLPLTSRGCVDGARGCSIAQMNGVVSMHCRVFAFCDVDAEATDQQICYVLVNRGSWLDEPFRKGQSAHWRHGLGICVGTSGQPSRTHSVHSWAPGFKRHAAHFEILASIAAQVVCGACSTILCLVRPSRGQQAAQGSTNGIRAIQPPDLSTRDE